MTKMSFYEQVGIVIPGALFLFGMLLLFPQVKSAIADNGITVGGLGVFVLIAYAAGHAVAAVANVLEKIFWLPFGGMPSNRIIQASPRLVTTEQREAIRLRFQEQFKIEVPEWHKLDRKRWEPLFGQLYRDVLQRNPGRVQTFNGNYGLNRGLAAALLCLIPNVLLAAPSHQGSIVGGVLVLAAVYGYRMFRFGVHFAREVFFGFISTNAESPRAAPTRSGASAAELEAEKVRE